MKNQTIKQPASSIYLDNAATTILEPEVKNAMLPYWELEYGNPSTTYSIGAKAKVALEEARNTIKKIIGAHNGHIFFTSGGTESNNWAIRGAVERQNIRNIITSPIEHKSVLDTVQMVTSQRNCQLHYVRLTNQGDIDYENLHSLLVDKPHSLVTLMHGNNEIGVINDIDKIGRLCHQYSALFHTDMVQTMGYNSIKLDQMPVDLATGSAHKFHGPKGSGLLYVRDNLDIAPLLYGGAQEKGLRAGTENIANIVGMAKALTIASQTQNKNRDHLYSLKNYCLEQIQKHIPGTISYGNRSDPKQHLGSILSIGLPPPYNPETILFHLDIEGIAASAGSACMSGTTKRSHVLNALRVPLNQAVVRFSFSKYNTLSEIDLLIERLAKIKNDMNSQA